MRPCMKRITCSMSAIEPASVGVPTPRMGYMIAKARRARRALVKAAIVSVSCCLEYDLI